MINGCTSLTVNTASQSNSKQPPLLKTSQHKNDYNAVHFAKYKVKFKVVVDCSPSKDVKHHTILRNIVQNVIFLAVIVSTCGDLNTLA